MTHSKIKWNINEIRSIENNKRSYTSEKKTLILHTEQNMSTYIQQGCI